MKNFLCHLMAGVALLISVWVPADAGQIADKAEAVNPIAVGEQIPALTFTTIDGATFDFNKALKQAPALLIFYRGSWCPYCNTHLAELRKIEKDLIDKGVQIYAVSPDLPEYLRRTVDKHQVEYSLLSDSKMIAAQKLGLAFKVGAATRLKYKTFGIDLAKNSGEKHHLLPVPAAILLDKQGEVKFIFYSPNYKIRVDNAVLLAAVDAMLAEETDSE